MGKESAMKIREVQDRTAPLVTALLAVWEKSVRATHTFLSEEEIEHIKTYVPTAFHSVQHLLTAETASGEPVAFIPRFPAAIVTPTHCGRLKYSVRIRLDRQ